MHFAKCDFEDCDRKENCERYTKATGSVVNFKVICHNIGYRWFVNGENGLVKVEKDEEKESEEKESVDK